MEREKRETEVVHLSDGEEERSGASHQEWMDGEREKERVE